MLNNTNSYENRVIEKAQDFGSTLEDLLDIIDNLDQSFNQANYEIERKDAIINEQAKENKNSSC